MRTLIARGYSPTAASTPGWTEYFCLHSGTAKRCTEDEVTHYVYGRCHIAFILPTVLSRCKFAEHLCALQQFITELRRARERLPSVHFAGMICVQGGPTDAEETINHIRRLLTGLSLSGENLTLCGVAMGARSKVAALNLGFHIFGRAGANGIGWIDDDVLLSRGSLGAIAETLVQNHSLDAVGARKRGRPREFVASRALHRAKTAMSTLATQYPHGCCIIVRASAFPNGIPNRYICDDGFVCFELLEPTKPKPLGRLYLNDEAQVDHFVGGRAWEIYHRVRRSLLCLAIFIADYPWPKGRWYLKYIQFYGLWPVAPFDKSNGISAGLRKWCLKLVLFIWFAEVVGELLLRGALRRPLREIRWSAYRWRSVAFEGPDHGAL
jgi:hypothetical protein